MAEHSHFTDIAVHLFPRPASVPKIRALARSVLADWGLDQDSGDRAEVLVSELVTNAIGARAPGDELVGVRLLRPVADGPLRLEVSDPGAGVPRMRVPGGDEQCGRGLLLVEALADSWGWTPCASGTGKTVWAELWVTGEVLGPACGEITAVCVQPGQSVRTRGGWHTVRAVRADRFAGEGPAVILEFDGLPALRLHAGQRLSVRSAPPGPAGRTETGARAASGPGGGQD
ncbi:ATP-binding protein [Streptomyces carpaticus]|uniref:ATP-binding protein n=1 Tax=Streptomyces carpaticus TaxID=285558 RepID=A0ABV4ZS10_9ACTN